MRQRKIRGSRLNSRPFYTTVFLISTFAAVSFLSQVLDSRSVSARTEATLLRRSEEPQCEQVRSVQDQCAFVKEYCIDEDAGLLPYLQLYYCTFHSAKPFAFVILLVWLGLLFSTIGIAASDFFSVNLSTIATILGLSESLAGVTFLAFGNGSPDVFSTFAAMGSNSASMAFGELIGAASFITGVVAGSMALVREFRVDKSTYARDICFFIVAVSFTMFFLADGELRFWECCLMIGYYIIYVATVVFLHWRTTVRRARRKREGEARSHVYGMIGQTGDELAGEPYRDDPHDAEDDHGTTPGAGANAGDMSSSAVFEQGPRIEIDGGHAVIQEEGNEDNEDEMDDEDHRRMVAAEVTSSMRVLRRRSRRGQSKNPIRPSLVGALEFRSALAQLQRESNLPLASIPSYTRSNSEALLSRRDTVGIYSGEPWEQARHTVHAPEVIGSRRDRALSASAAVSAGFPNAQNVWDDQSPRILPFEEEQFQNPFNQTQRVSHTVGGNLAPPPAESGPGGSSAGSEDGSTPKLHLQIPSRRSSHSDASSGAGSPFPRYMESPLIMTPNDHHPVLTPRDSNLLPLPALSDEPKPVKWWPYAIFPPPHILMATFFPTLSGWSEKMIWDKFVSIISVPSIFLLVITLPVVEPDPNADSLDAETAIDAVSTRSLGQAVWPTTPDLIEVGEERREGEWERYRRRTLQREASYSSEIRIVPAGNEGAEDGAVTPGTHAHRSGSVAGLIRPASEHLSVSNANDESWNRWLVCLQLFTGPLFAVFILWANMAEDLENPYKDLARMVLYTLLVSLILLGFLLFTTSEHKRPKYHFLFCFLGFVIAIAWISTIAGEVVGVLKTFGVVLGISEALLGLTIFAAGNSVGDLVADITVARLGYPVMAL